MILHQRHFLRAMKNRFGSNSGQCVEKITLLIVFLCDVFASRTADKRYHFKILFTFFPSLQSSNELSPVQSSQMHS